MSIVFDGLYQIFKVSGMGPYDNNGYVLADPLTREAYLVDAPSQVERLLDEAKDFRIKAVLITHTHPDHIAGYADLKRLTDIPVAVHEADVRRLPGEPEILLAHGDDLAIGSTKLHVMHTPGHTPGGICLSLDGALISGDTLFPGGPGRTRSGEDFKQIMDSITTQVYPLPERTLVLPGHGADTTIAESKREYAVFARKPHHDSLYDNVLWLTS